MKQSDRGTLRCRWSDLFGAAVLCGMISGCPGSHVIYMPPPALPHHPNPWSGNGCFPVVLGDCADPAIQTSSAWGRGLICKDLLSQYHLNIPLEDFCHSLGLPFETGMFSVNGNDLVDTAKAAELRYGGDVPYLERELWRQLELHRSSRIPVCHIQVDLKKIELTSSDPGFFCGHKDGFSERMLHVDLTRLPDGSVYTLSAMEGSESCLRHKSGHSIPWGIFEICAGKNETDDFRLRRTLSEIWSVFWRGIAQQKVDRFMRKCVPHRDDD